MPNLKHEHQHGYPSVLIAGVDEVGRGCIAGPVVAGAIILPSHVDFKKDRWLKEVDDSKKLKQEQRERLAPLILKWAYATGIGLATVEEIDQINIFHASHLALIRAVKALKALPAHIMVDGKFLPKTGFPAPATAVVQGDHHCLSIAAASIIAKVWRDDHMGVLHTQYPAYGLAKHKGYPTPEHSRALRTHGATPIHRRSFKTVAEVLGLQLPLASVTGG